MFSAAAGKKTHTQKKKEKGLRKKKKREKEEGKRKERNLLFAFVFTDSGEGERWQRLREEYKAECTNGHLGLVDNGRGQWASTVGRGTGRRQWAERQHGA